MAPELPRMPELPPERPVKASAGGRMLVVFFAVGSLLTMLAFVSLFYPGFAIVIGFAAALFLFHYVVWGWWLGRIIRESESDATDE